jgi:hypothetical protein
MKDSTMTPGDTMPASRMPQPVRTGAVPPQRTSSETLRLRAGIGRPRRRRHATPPASALLH